MRIARDTILIPKYSNQEVIGRMFSESVKKLAGESTDP